MRILFWVFQKLKPSLKNSKEVNVKFLGERVLCCGGIHFLIVTCLSELVGKSFVKFQLGNYLES